MLKLYIKDLYFLNPEMDFVYIWYDYRCWSKIFLGTIHIPAHDLEVKVTDLEKFYVKVLCQSFYVLLISKFLYGFALYLA